MALKFKLFLGLLAAVFFVGVLRLCLDQDVITIVHAQSGTYTTTFPRTESPISESGNWVGGSTAGGNLWGNLRTTPGLVFGVSEPTQFGDPTAILTGSWGQTQSAQATVKIVSTPSGCCHEVELRLRMTISSNSIAGYELLCPVHSSPGYGYQIVRWNGANGQYVYIGGSGTEHQCVNGDVLMATATGTNPTIINFYNNGTVVATACDNGQGPGGSCGGVTYSGPGGAAGPFTSGNPGIGFYDNSDSNWSNFGFSSFTASGGSNNPPVSNTPASPTNLGAVVD